MQPFEPDFEIIKMDAEVASYQEDFGPEEEREGGHVAPPPSVEGTGDDASG